MDYREEGNSSLIYPHKLHRNPSGKHLKIGRKMVQHNSRGKGKGSRLARDGRPRLPAGDWGCRGVAGWGWRWGRGKANPSLGLVRHQGEGQSLAGDGGGGVPVAAQGCRRGGAEQGWERRRRQPGSVALSPCGVRSFFREENEGPKGYARGEEGGGDSGEYGAGTV